VDTPADPKRLISPWKVETPTTLRAADVLPEVPTVAIPVIVISVAPIPPLLPPTCKVYPGTVVPTPTLLSVASPTIRLVFTSTPFLMTKFLLIAIRVHSPPYFLLFSKDLS